MSVPGSAALAPHGIKQHIPGQGPGLAGRPCPPQAQLPIGTEPLTSRCPWAEDRFSKLEGRPMSFDGAFSQVWGRAGPCSPAVVPGDQEGGVGWLTSPLGWDFGDEAWCRLGVESRLAQSSASPHLLRVGHGHRPPCPWDSVPGGGGAYAVRGNLWERLGSSWAGLPLGALFPEPTARSGSRERPKALLRVPLGTDTCWGSQRGQSPARAAARSSVPGALTFRCFLWEPRVFRFHPR